MLFAQRLATLMKEKGVSKYRLAKDLTCHQTSVTNWIDGKSVPQKRTMFQIASYFDVSLEWLKGETDIRKPTSKNGDGLSGTNYDLLTPEHQKIVDSLIEQLLASQSPE